MYNHYLRLDKDNYIIRAFSDAFEQSQEGDVLFSKSENRHFYVDELGFNPNLSEYQYIDNKIIFNQKSKVDKPNPNLTDQQLTDIIKFALENNAEFRKLVLPIV